MSLGLNQEFLTITPKIQPCEENFENLDSVKRMKRQDMYLEKTFANDFNKGLDPE